MENWGRVAVIGDVGGHLIELIEMLVELGMDPQTGDLPEDLTVVQVGDLVHRGPHSADAVFFIDTLMRKQPGQWVQLLGNHEQLEVAEAVFVWNEIMDDTAVKLMEQWWATGLMNPAAAITTEDGASWLATHAGLTSGFWQEIGSPSNAVRAARILNAIDRSPGAPLWRPGCMLGHQPTFRAGPIWAAAGEELIPSWLAERSPMPFNQVHGHSCAVNRKTGRAHLLGPAAVTEYDPARAHETSTAPGGHVIVGIDPTHGQHPRKPWAPLLFERARVA